MALSRRTGARFQASIWPGFVDAMTGLLLVLMFVLTIFMVVQAVLRDTITGQENELNNLSTELSELARALGLERQRNTALTNEMGALNATLDDTQTRLTEQEAIIASLSATRDRQAAALQAADARIASFEEQVAGLLSERSSALEQISDLTSVRDQLLSEQEALNLALATARGEIDEQVEAARLAAARREALEALVADLRARNAESADQIGTLTAQVGNLETQLSEEEAAKLAEAAAAEALRARLQDADAELTAMTMALEEQRARAEETLTLLAAAREAENDLNARLAAALLEGRETADGLQARLDAALAESEATAAALRADLDAAVARGDETAAALQARLADQAEQIASLQQDLQQAQVDRTSLSSLEARLSEALIRVAEANALEARLEDLRAENAALSQGLNAAEQSGAEAEAALEALRQALAEAQAEAASRADQEQTLEQRLTAALAQQMSVEATLEETRDRLAAALAAQVEAETALEDRLSEAEQRQVLLEQARDRLSEESQRATEAQRQTELLNQQVGALRRQLSSLQAVLDDAVARDAAAQIELQSLGSELNTALARVAAEERRRRQLEEAERIRLEEERKRLEEEKQRLAGENQDLERYRSEFFGRLRDVLGGRDGVRIAGDRFVFSSEVLFPPAEASLSDEGRAQIANVAAILRDVAQDIPDELNWIIRVDGHTDNLPLSGQGEYADNWELSQARALSVVRFMIDELGIPPRRLSANGFGEYQPINSEDTAEARAQNRRIELKLTEQ